MHSTIFFTQGHKAALAGEDFDSNPHKARGYGDPGPQRTEWFAGYNAGLYERVGIKRINRDIMDEEDRCVFNGRWIIGRIASYAQAVETAKVLTEKYGVPFLGEDRGEWTRPQFAVIAGFQVGEPVSYGFNGDYYPCGFITSISGIDGNRKIEATDNRSHKRLFWRRRKTASWVHDQTWGLVHGWHNELNPSF